MMKINDIMSLDLDMLNKYAIKMPHCHSRMHVTKNSLAYMHDEPEKAFAPYLIKKALEDALMSGGRDQIFICNEEYGLCASDMRKFAAIVICSIMNAEIVINRKEGTIEFNNGSRFFFWNDTRTNFAGFNGSVYVSGISHHSIDEQKRITEMAANIALAGHPILIHSSTPRKSWRQRILGGYAISSILMEYEKTPLDPTVEFMFHLLHDRAPSCNNISGITKQHFHDLLDMFCLPYQRAISNHRYNSDKNPFRIYLHDSHLSLCEYFAIEALEDAEINGNDQLFLFAPTARVSPNMLMAYVRKIYEDMCGVVLRTNYYDLDDSKSSITLSNGATLRFQYTSSATTAGFSGNVYINGLYHLPDLVQDALETFSRAISMKKDSRLTVFSDSPNMAKTLQQWAEKGIDISKALLPCGVIDDDGIFRNIFTNESTTHR